MLQFAWGQNGLSLRYAVEALNFSVWGKTVYIKEHARPSLPSRLCVYLDSGVEGAGVGPSSLRRGSVGSRG